MPGFRGLNVSAADGDRWELALNLLETGDAPVRLGSITLCRDVGAPNADGHIHIEFPCLHDPDRITPEAGAHDLDSARSVVQAASAADHRFALLLHRFGFIYEYVHDYGMGGVLLATAREDGSLTWQHPGGDSRG